jgi:hypothetical protein
MRSNSNSFADGFHTINGTKYWIKNGCFHREDGPAIMWVYGREDYYVEGKHISKEDYLYKLHEYKLKENKI